MINVSSNIKNACKSDKLTYREYIILNGSNTQIDVKAKLYQTAYKDNHFIGTFNISYIKFSTDNSVDYKKKEFTYYKEINGNSIQIGKYIVTDVKDNDTGEEVEVTAYDNGLKFDVPYVTELDYSSNEVTLLDVLQECCTKCGVQLDNEEITNGDFIVDSNQFEENEITGNVISAIAFMSGDFAYITNTGKLKLKFYEETDEVIEDYVDLDDKRDTQPITSVSLGMSDVDGEAVIRKDQTLIEQYGEHWLIINDDPFAYTPEKREELIDGIFDKVKGFGYSSFTAKDVFMPYMELGDLIQFKNKEGNLVNSIILREETDYEKMTLSAPSITKATLEYEPPMDAETLSKQTRLIVDKENQRITSVITQIGDRTGKTTTLTQDINGINLNIGVMDTTKGTLSEQTANIRADINGLRSEIGNVTDVTITKEGNGTLYFNGETESINESNPISMLIYPTTEDISCIYPRTNLYPSTTMYPIELKIDFYNETEDDHIYYPFPKNLRRVGDVYDEFQYDYENQTCKVVRRIGINSYGEKSILQTPEEEEIEFPDIHLYDGKYTVTFVPFSTAHMKIVLMSQNMYTSQFATKVELNGKYEFTYDHFTMELGKKVGEEEVIAKINGTAEDITIQANKIDLNGVATFTNNKLATAGSTVINGSNITTGVIDASSVLVENISADNINSGIISAALIDAGSITGDKIAAGTITGNKLDINGVITSINNNTSTTINGNKITTGSITSSQIAADAITADKINVTNLSSVSSDLGSITGGSLNIGSGNFTVTSGGVITAKSGTIGGWTLTASTLKNTTGSGTTTLNSNGRLSFSNGDYFFGVGNGSAHPVMSALSTPAVNFYSGLSVSGGGTWRGGTGIFGDYISLLCSSTKEIAIGLANTNGTAINASGSLRYSPSTGNWTIRTDSGGLYLRPAGNYSSSHTTWGIHIYGSYNNNTGYHDGWSGMLPYARSITSTGYMYFVNGIFVGHS